MTEKKKAAIVGATGMAGQQFISALRNHPLIEISCLAASERSAGKSYGEAISVGGAFSWYCDEPPPKEILSMIVENAEALDVKKFDLVFSAVESDAALVLEPKFAKEVPVISTAAAFRYEADVPIIIPGVNSYHHYLIETQRKNRGWKGFIVPIPNCTTTGLAITLKPIIFSPGIEYVYMTSMQAVSGAGRSPGVRALDIIDNIIPYIPKEEEKVERETKKILGTYLNSEIIDAEFVMSATCTRVPVRHGHTESVFVKLRTLASLNDIREKIAEFNSNASKELEGLPSAPKEMIVVFDDPFMPQPRLVRDIDEGMATSIGRIRCVGKDLAYVLVSHNLKIGAAKGAVLLAELLMKKGYIE